MNELYTTMPVDVFGRSAATGSFEAASLNSLIGTKVSRSGDSLSGDLSLDGHRLKQVPHEPTAATDGAAASFVIAGDIAVKDAAVLRSGVQTMTGNLDLDSHYITNVIDPANQQDAATKNYVDLRGSMRLFVGGGTMMGDIQMTDHHITGLADPSENQDAATKWYVDSMMATPVCGPAIFRQQLLEVGALLAKIPLSVVGAATSGIILADPTTIHITTGGLYRFEVCGCCVATAPPAHGVCSDGLIRVGTPTHTICWTPVGGDRNTSFSRFMYYRVANGENVYLKCQKTGTSPLNIAVWLTVKRVWPFKLWCIEL